MAERPNPKKPKKPKLPKDPEKREQVMYNNAKKELYKAMKRDLPSLPPYKKMNNKQIEKVMSISKKYDQAVRKGEPDFRNWLWQDYAQQFRAQKKKRFEEFKKNDKVWKQTAPGYRKRPPPEPVAFEQSGPEGKRARKRRKVEMREHGINYRPEDKTFANAPFGTPL